MAEYTEIQMPSTTAKLKHWTMYVYLPQRLAYRLSPPKGWKLQYVLQIMFKVSNNTTEYEAALHGLHIAISLGIKH